MILGSNLGGPGGGRWGSVGRIFGSWSCLGPKMGPRPPQDLSKTPPGTNFKGFGVPNWWIFGSYLVDFGRILHPILEDFLLLLGWLFEWMVS